MGDLRRDRREDEERESSFEEMSSYRRCRALIADEREREAQKELNAKSFTTSADGRSIRGRGRGLVSVRGLSTDFIEIAKYRYAVMA